MNEQKTENCMVIPKTLKHKPVFVVENYNELDGNYSPESTDVKGLSIGLAQWNDRGKVDISCKVWRYTGEKWSRQSEELPLHRVLDLAIMIAETKGYMAEESYKYKSLYNKEKPTIADLDVCGKSMKIDVATDNPMVEEDIVLFRDVLCKEDELLSQRLHYLADILKKYNY